MSGMEKVMNVIGMWIWLFGVITALAIIGVIYWYAGK